MKAMVPTASDVATLDKTELAVVSEESFLGENGVCRSVASALNRRNSKQWHLDEVERIGNLNTPQMSRPSQDAHSGTWINSSTSDGQQTNP
jgi:hypothetical protein